MIGLLSAHNKLLWTLRRPGPQLIINVNDDPHDPCITAVKLVNGLDLDFFAKSRI